MSRNIDSATKSALSNPVLPIAAIIRLDIENDPLLAWTGIGDLVFAPGQTGDPALDGLTFKGTAAISEIASITEGDGGSGALELTAPGVDITDVAARQVIYNHNRFRFRQAWVWLVLFDEVTGAIVGKPFRVKTGRIDQMPYQEDESGKATIKCRIESQASYSEEALNTTYSGQKDIDSTDNSQDWVTALANQTPGIGQQNTPSASTPASISGGGGGRSLKVANV